MKIEYQWSEKASDFIRSKVVEYNMQFIPNEARTLLKKMSFIYRNNENEIFGGITAHTFWNQMHIDFLWVSEEFRHSGYGSQLLKQMEALALEMGCRVIQLDTFSFQAPEFYIKNGYKVIGLCKDFIEGADQYYLEKNFRIGD